MRLVLGFLVLISTFLTGCEKTGDETPPEISEVYSNVTYFHPSYWEKAGKPANIALASTLAFRINDPDGITDLFEVDLLNTSSGLSYDLITRINNLLFGSDYDIVTDTFQNMFSNTADQTRIDLQDWEISARDLSFFSDRRAFDLKLPDGELVSTEDYVYSPAYAGDKSSGIEAMQAMTIADHGLSFTADTGNQLFTIEFETTDPKAKNYSVLLYSDDPQVADVGVVGHVGQAKYDAPSVVDAPIILGQKTILTLYWDDIDLHRNFTTADLLGAHVVLYDDATEFGLIANETWFNYLGVSEFFTLTQ